MKIIIFTCFKWIFSLNYFMKTWIFNGSRRDVSTRHARGIYKGRRRCSEVTATIGFILYHMACKLFFLGSWSAQNDSKWKHFHHVCVHYMTSSDTRVTCVPWGIIYILISNMLTGLRLISTCDTVCIMWLQM